MLRKCGWVLAAALLLPAWSSGQEPPRLSGEGRFLYADDDDWDWASPAGANEPCRLSVYGRMPWSALDWMEEGLPEVRAVLIGTPPASGNYLTMADLNRIRKAGPKRSYEQLQHTPNILANLLKDRKPPNLIIMMQDIGGVAPPITADDVNAALEYVRPGGRLIILDDWKYYRSLVGPFVDRKRFGPRPQPVLDEKLRREAGQKVRLLGDTNFRTRERARTDLLKMGKVIVPVLEGVQPENPEQRARVEAILRSLRPPAAKLPGDEDGWMAEAVQAALQIHPLCALKTISRNGQQQPGSALCLRLPAAESRK